MTSYERKRAEAKRKQAEKIQKVSKARTAVNGVFIKALRNDVYTMEERNKLSDAVRALDSVIGGYCNRRRR